MRLTFIIFVLLFSGMARANSFQVYTQGDRYYIAAPKQILVVPSDIIIIVPISQKNSFSVLEPKGGGWVLRPLTEAEWRALNIENSTNFQKVTNIFSASFNSLRLVWSNPLSPAVSINGFDGQLTFNFINLDGSLLVQPLRRIIYLHTDVLGSVIGETDGNGQIIRQNNYTPFGGVKN